MSISSPTASPPSPEHPGWCDPNLCSAGDPTRSYHWGTPRSVAARQAGDVSVTAQLCAEADEPVTVANVGIEITLRRSDLLSVEAYNFGPAAFLDLLDAMDAYREAMQAEVTRDASRRTNADAAVALSPDGVTADNLDGRT